MIMKRKTVFDIIKEADEDDNQNKGDDNVESSPQEDNQETNTDDTENNDMEDNGEDEDFNIDTNLDTDTSDEDTDIGTEDSNQNNDNSGEGSEENTEEPVKANTDIFNSLSEDEQKIKIKELKNLYNNLYTSCCDLLEKINNLDPDENLGFIERVSGIIYSLKKYIAEYIVSVFPNKSYIENDIAFNRFLTILKSTTSIINDINSLKNEKR